MKMLNEPKPTNIAKRLSRVAIVENVTDLRRVLTNLNGDLPTLEGISTQMYVSLRVDDDGVTYLNMEQGTGPPPNPPGAYVEVEGGITYWKEECAP